MTDTLSQLIYDAAVREIGVTEWAKGHNPAILEYFRAAGHAEVGEDEVPWCAAFVNAILGRCGIAGTQSLAARSFQHWGDPVTLDDAQPGDVVVFWRGKRDGWQGHVGFFAGYDGTKIRVLGGNQSDAVRVTSYSTVQLLGIRRARMPRAGAVTQSKTVRAGAVGLAGTVVTAASGLFGEHIGAIVGKIPEWAWGAAFLLGLTATASGIVFMMTDRGKKWLEGVR